jgi:hypothetical protein
MSITPTIDTDELSRAQFDGQGQPQTALDGRIHSLSARCLVEFFNRQRALRELPGISGHSAQWKPGSELISAV